MVHQFCYTNNEQVLLALVARGDQKAFSLIMEKYTSFINHQLSAYLKDSMKAEEISQDVFMSLWKHRDKLPALENFPGFVYVVTRNKVRQWKKREVCMTELTDDRSQYADPAVELKELHSLLHKGIDMLPQKRREVFKLSRLEGLSIDEIAASLKLSRNTIREHIREALAFLRVYIPQCFADLDHLQYGQRRKPAAAA